MFFCLAQCKVHIVCIINDFFLYLIQIRDNFIHSGLKNDRFNPNICCVNKDFDLGVLVRGPD